MTMTKEIVDEAYLDKVVTNIVRQNDVNVMNWSDINRDGGWKGKGFVESGIDILVFKGPVTDLRIWTMAETIEDISIDNRQCWQWNDAVTLIVWNKNISFMVGSDFIRNK